jgi:hypothetical protein
MHTLRRLIRFAPVIGLIAVLLTATAMLAEAQNFRRGTTPI